MTSSIDPEDRVTYAEAVAITGRSPSYLRQQAQLGRLTRDGGQRWQIHTTWLSRTECEALALAVYRRGRATDYWVTMSQAAELLNIARQHAHKALKSGRLPARQTHMGDWLLRRNDVLKLASEKAFRGRRNAS